MYVNTQIMFPPWVIPTLRDACGPEWQRLVDRVTPLEETHPESLAFSLMKIRLDGCLECETDSFRAMRGCAACALQSVRRYRSNEGALLRQYHVALDDVRSYLGLPPADGLASGAGKRPNGRAARPKAKSRG